MQLIDALTDSMQGIDQPIMAIDGPAGSGKTTLANSLLLVLSPQMTTTVIHMDWLYPGWDDALGSTLTETLLWLTQSHKERRDLRFSTFNWATNAFDPPHTVPSTDLLILEGVGSAQKAIEEELVTSIWLDLDPQIGFQRVIDRDGQSITSQMQKWLLHQEQHFMTDKTKERCEFVLST